MTVDYDAALRAARDAVPTRSHTAYCSARYGEACDCGIDDAMRNLEALARAVGATEEHAQHVTFVREGYCAACHEVGPCEVEAEADRLAAPYLETEESMHSKREAR